MTTAAEWLALAEKARMADGPNMEITEAIAVSCGYCLHKNKIKSGYQSDTGFDCVDCGADSWGNKNKIGQGLYSGLPNLTASIDAIVALIEKEMPGCGFCVSLPSNQGPHYATGSVEQSEDAWTYDGWPNCRAATPALALVAAFCEAKAAHAKEQENGR